jgi:hypothetical protein
LIAVIVDGEAKDMGRLPPDVAIAPSPLIG